MNPLTDVVLPALPAAGLIAAVVRSHFRCQRGPVGDTWPTSPGVTPVSVPPARPLRPVRPAPSVEEVCRACGAAPAAVLASFTGSVAGERLALELPLCAGCLAASDGTATVRPLTDRKAS